VPPGASPRGKLNHRSSNVNIRPPDRLESATISSRPSIATLEPINPGSVVDLVYRRIRALIESGDLGGGARLRQGDLAAAMAVSRSTVREALHRLTAEELVEFRANRGFFVASFHLDAVVERLELRLLLEPGIARIAATRATPEAVATLEQITEAQAAAKTSQFAHDMSRGFHIELARATGNDQFVRVLDGLWSLDIGRQLLAQRSVVPGWQAADAAEHRSILESVAAGDADEAATRMHRHVAATIAHWSAQAGEEDA
jgi:DNA-binding GntR family transcriptional regulator